MPPATAARPRHRRRTERPAPPPPVRALAVAVLLGVLAAGCSALGIRQQVDEAQARDVLGRAVGVALSGQAGQICALSPADASTCDDTIVDLDDRVPERGPTIRCVVPAPDEGPLRHGQVVVLEGVDGAGEEYRTEFVVYDTGEGVGVLDAVWWSGLHIVSYTDREVAWRFDSASTACDDGGLPVQGDVQGEG